MYINHNLASHFFRNTQSRLGRELGNTSNEKCASKFLNLAETHFLIENISNMCFFNANINKLESDRRTDSYQICPNFIQYIYKTLLALLDICVYLFMGLCVLCSVCVCVSVNLRNFKAKGNSRHPLFLPLSNSLSLPLSLSFSLQLPLSISFHAIPQVLPLYVWFLN